MRPFICGQCSQLVFFDNSSCLRCGSALGFVPERNELESVAADGTPAGGGSYRWCANQLSARCNWLIPSDDPNPLCRSCRLTTVRPNDSDGDAMVAFADAESAKRRLLYQLARLGLEIVDREHDADTGLAFELLSARNRSVITGHEDGLITLDLSESDDAHRIFVREQLGEPYRTVLGHLRHEIGHYYWLTLVSGRPDVLDRFRGLFGDERVSYEEAMQEHYDANGDWVDGDDSWRSGHVSRYATMHPWEDWAETFAHYLHIDDGLETAQTFGLGVGDPARAAGLEAWSAPTDVAIGPMVGDWLALTIALNGMSRSIGQGDLYPFVLSPDVVAKLDMVHQIVTSAAVSARG